MNTSSRTCGRCTMCCKTHSIASIQKPRGEWCTHCKIGRSCSIYPTRPRECRKFVCQWLLGFGSSEMRPDKCGFVVDLTTTEEALQVPGKLVVIHEAVEGALESALAKAVTRTALEAGFFVGYVFSSGKGNLFVPHGVELSPEVEKRVFLEEIEIKK